MGKADKDYFLDEDRKVTTSEEKAAVLLIRKGQEIPKEMADKYPAIVGNRSDAASSDADDSAKAKKPAAENKAKSPKANK